MSFEWKDLVGTIAPTLATALGGPLAGMAVKKLSDAVLGKPDGTEKEISKAMELASPETLAKLKEIDNEFEVEMKQLDIDLEAIAQENTASARAREIAVKDKIPAILAVSVTVGFFGVLGFMLYSPATAQSDALLVMLGALGGSWGAVMNYYFGSSSGSAKKNSMLLDKK